MSWSVSKNILRWKQVINSFPGEFFKKKIDKFMKGFVEWILVRENLEYMELVLICFKKNNWEFGWMCSLHFQEILFQLCHSCNKKVQQSVIFFCSFNGKMLDFFFFVFNMLYSKPVYIMMYIVWLHFEGQLVQKCLDYHLYATIFSVPCSSTTIFGLFLLL